MFVLECSVALAWCMPDENDTYADDVLDLLINQQAIVPSLWHLEVMNVLLELNRRESGNPTPQEPLRCLLVAVMEMPVKSSWRKFFNCGILEGLLFLLIK